MTTDLRKQPVAPETTDLRQLDPAAIAHEVWDAGFETAAGHTRQISSDGTLEVQLPYGDQPVETVTADDYDARQDPSSPGFTANDVWTMGVAAGIYSALHPEAEVRNLYRGFPTMVVPVDRASVLDTVSPAVDSPVDVRPDIPEVAPPTPTIPIAKGEPIAGQPRTFELIRHKDHSGVSGIGLVCWGVVYPDGRVSTRWAQSEFGRQTSAWDCLADVLSVHGHKGSTEIRWHDGGDESGPPELDGDDATEKLYILLHEAKTAIQTAKNQGNHMLGIVSAQFVVDCLLDSGFVDNGS